MKTFQRDDVLVHAHDWEKGFGFFVCKNTIKSSDHSGSGFKMFSCFFFKFVVKWKLQHLRELSPGGQILSLCESKSSVGLGKA